MRTQYQSLLLAIKLQTVLSLILSVGIILVSVRASYSVAIGAGISILVSGLMIQIVKPKPGQTPEAFMGKLIVAESAKFFAITLLMAISLNFFRVDPPFLLLGFIFALLGYWIILAFTLQS